jgi:hypothetical protein
MPQILRDCHDNYELDKRMVKRSIRVLLLSSRNEVLVLVITVDETEGDVRGNHRMKLEKMPFTKSFVDGHPDAPGRSPAKVRTIKALSSPLVAFVTQTIGRLPLAPKLEGIPSCATDHFEMTTSLSLYRQKEPLLSTPYPQVPMKEDSERGCPK